MIEWSVVLDSEHDTLHGFSAEVVRHNQNLEDTEVSRYFFKSLEE